MLKGEILIVLLVLQGCCQATSAVGNLLGSNLLQITAFEFRVSSSTQWFFKRLSRMYIFFLHLQVAGCFEHNGETQTSDLAFGVLGWSSLLLGPGEGVEGLLANSCCWTCPGCSASCRVPSRDTFVSLGALCPWSWCLQELSHVPGNLWGDVPWSLLPVPCSAVASGCRVGKQPCKPCGALSSTVMVCPHRRWQLLCVATIEVAREHMAVCKWCCL